MGGLKLAPSDILMYAICVAVIVLALLRLAGVHWGAP